MSQEEQVSNTVLDYANHKFAPETTETPSETAIVTETPVQTTEAPVATEIVETTTTTEAPIETPTELPDYSKIIAEVSGGVFTDLDSFKASLPKLQEYDTVLQSKTELEEKVKGMITPANEYAKTLNEMLQAGKSLDEIENFTKISKTEIDQLSAIDSKVMNMVRKGYNEQIAKQIVEEDFPIKDFEEGSKERLILEEKLRVSSAEDRKELKEYKKEITTIDNSASEQAEQQRLQQIAQQTVHKQAVKSAIPAIAEKITGLGERNLNGKEGEEAVKLNFDYNQEFKAELPAKLESFFLDGQMEVTPENIELANHYIKADYLAKNFDNIAQSIYKHAEALATEKTVNKYENRTGLPPESTNVVVDTTKDDYNAFLHKMVKSR